MVVVEPAADIELPLGQMDKTLPPIEGDGRLVAGIHAQQEALDAGSSGEFDGVPHQTFAGAAAVIAAEQADAFEFEIASRVRARPLGTGEHQVAYRGVAGSDLGQPDGGLGIGQPVAVLRGRMRAGAVLDDGGAVENAGEGFQERRLADQRQRILVTWPGAADR
jgi:hypothetical protein